MLRLLWISSLLVIAASRSLLERVSDGGTVFHRLFVSEHKLTEDELKGYLKAMDEHSGMVMCFSLESSCSNCEFMKKLREFRNYPDFSNHRIF